MTPKTCRFDRGVSPFALSSRLIYFFLLQDEPVTLAYEQKALVTETFRVRFRRREDYGGGWRNIPAIPTGCPAFHYLCIMHLAVAASMVETVATGDGADFSVGGIARLVRIPVLLAEFIIMLLAIPACVVGPVTALYTTRTRIFLNGFLRHGEFPSVAVASQVLSRGVRCLEPNSSKDAKRALRPGCC